MIKLHHKQMHISKLFSYENPYSSQVYKNIKINPYTQHTYTQTANTNLQSQLQDGLQVDLSWW